jgi:hypothetical protein
MPAAPDDDRAAQADQSGGSCSMLRWDRGTVSASAQSRSASRRYRSMRACRGSIANAPRQWTQTLASTSGSATGRGD